MPQNLCTIAFNEMHVAEMNKQLEVLKKIFDKRMVSDYRDAYHASQKKLQKAKKASAKAEDVMVDKFSAFWGARNAFSWGMVKKYGNEYREAKKNAKMAKKNVAQTEDVLVAKMCDYWAAKNQRSRKESCVAKKGARKAKKVFEPVVNYSSSSPEYESVE